MYIGRQVLPPHHQEHLWLVNQPLALAMHLSHCHDCWSLLVAMTLCWSCETPCSIAVADCNSDAPKVYATSAFELVPKNYTCKQETLSNSATKLSTLLS